MPCQRRAPSQLLGHRDVAQDRVADAAVARRVLFADLPDSVPGAEVRPARAERHHAQAEILADVLFFDARRVRVVGDQFGVRHHQQARAQALLPGVQVQAGNIDLQQHAGGRQQRAQHGRPADPVPEYVAALEAAVSTPATAGTAAADQGPAVTAAAVS